MFFHLFSFFYALIYFFALEIIVFYPHWFFYVSGGVAFIVWLAAKKVAYRKSSFLVPLIFAWSAMTLLFLIDNFQQEQIFIGISSFLFYLFFLGMYRLKSYLKDKTAQGLLAATSLAGLFLFYSAGWGIYLNFLIPLWIMILVYSLITFLFSYYYLCLIDWGKKRKCVLFSLILSLGIAEMVWGVNFWPFGYLSTGVILLIIYFLLWDIIQNFLKGEFTYKRTYFTFLLFTFLIGIILYTTKWLPF